MDINKINRINNVNNPVPREKEKKTSGLEPKQADISASEALNAYGKAIVNHPRQNETELFNKLLADAKKNYIEKLDNMDTKGRINNRKKSFIQFISDISHDGLDSKEINKKCKSYLLSGYLEDDMKLFNELFYYATPASGDDIASVLYNVIPENKDILQAMLDSEQASSRRFYMDDLAIIIPNVTPENRDILLEMIKDNNIVRIPYGYGEVSSRFTGAFISNILENIDMTPENMYILNTLIKAKKGN